MWWAVKKLFLSYYHGDVDEVSELAVELRLRGVVPWVDKQGGFSVADKSTTEARRAIREDCFGLLLYATPQVFESDFIRNVEMFEGRLQHETGEFSLFALPRKISFASLGQSSRQSFGIDLSEFHTIPLPDEGSLHERQKQVAVEVLRMALLSAEKPVAANSPLILQFSTRELLPDEDGQILRIDGTELLDQDITKHESWNRLLSGLRDVKREITRSLGRPRLTVHGSKHLTSAFLFGRVFSPFDLDIRQTPTQIWPTDARFAEIPPLIVSTQLCHLDGAQLSIEISFRYKNVVTGVTEYIRRNTSFDPAVRLQIQPASGALDLNDQLCAASAYTIYRAIEQTLGHYPNIKEIHLFAAAPQAFMMMLGHSFRGMPSVYLYEWTEAGYVHSFCVPSANL